ncbi:MAG: N-acetyl-1-D-myo-inositol-2-amino-2-deoxy-alpha-D-glucopyranoside deacetylase [Pseudonocardiaceae bacterium]|nr:N-acetyl-1-D-myo-inositol-2-amino-2-deoxy-alpha-D-glucopyranoside deacetylase [Pseudonocardiaceae bacterium]
MVLVHAHPDDETIATGGTIARYAAEGVAVTLVTCTLGEQGEVIPAELAGLAAEHADQLGGYRIGELRAAGSALGLTEQRFLGGLGRWRDSGMVVEPGGRASVPPDMHPRAFAGTGRGAQVDALLAVLDELRPEVVISYGPDGGYGHPDHVRAHEITMAAVEQLPQVHRVFWAVQSRSALTAGLEVLRRKPGLPFALPGPEGLPGVDDSEVTTTVDITAQLPAKLAALRAHRTQVAVWPDGPAMALSNRVARPVPAVEHFTLARGPVAAAEGLFEGLG